MEYIDPSASKERVLQALHWCVYYGHSDILDALLETHFSEAKISDNHGECDLVLMHTIQTGKKDMFLKLLPYVDPKFFESKDSRGGRKLITKFLCLAVSKGDEEMAVELIKEGADVTAFHHSRPLLHLALSQGQVPMARKLIEAGAIVQSLDHRGDSVLFSAMESEISSQTKVIDWLIHLGADWTKRNHAGREPIHVAATLSAALVDVFARVGCDVTARDDVNGDTPLHLACSRCCPDSVVCLIQHGAEINVLNLHHETPLIKVLKFVKSPHDFHSQTRIKLTKMLMEIGFHVGPISQTKYLSDPQLRKCLTTYRQILQRGINVNTMKHLCRLAIRQYLDTTNFEQNVHSLTIPKELHQYILFREM